MATKLGTKGETPIYDLAAPEGMTQAEYDHALTQHQRARDAENERLNRLCGGLEIPYLTSAPSPTDHEPALATEPRSLPRSYPARFEEAEEGGYVVTFPDIPEAITQGDDLDEARANAVGALVTALELYSEAGEKYPVPSERSDEGWMQIELPAAPSL